MEGAASLVGCSPFMIGAFYFFNTTESDSYALEASWISSSLSQLVAGSVLWL